MVDNNCTNGVPEYLNEDFFKRALQKVIRNDGKITDLHVEMGTNPGDNYSSKIYRVKVSYSEKTDLKNLSLIVKSIPKGGSREILEKLEFYGKERDMYLNVLPEIQKLLNITLAAKCYYATDDPMATFVFEDLKPLGYILGNREKGLNEAECKILLDKLGKFHAASIYLLDKKSELLLHDRYQGSWFTKESFQDPLMRSVFVDSLITEISVIEKWAGYENYVDKLKRVADNIEDRIIEVAKPDDDGVKVLIHGDLWVNNFMLKYSDKDPSQPEDLLMVDFQGNFVNSPGIDINYFLYTSVEHSVLENRRDVLIENYYYNSLKQSLIDLGHFNGPTLEDIKAEIRRKEFYGFISAVAILPIICIEKSDSTDCSLELLADKDQSEKKRLLACKTKRFEKMMKSMLERADSLGVLD